MRTKDLKRLGFRKLDNSNSWQRTRRVCDDTSLTVTVNMDDMTAHTYVLNESFGQPEYYMNMLEPFRDYIVAAINLELYKLQTDLNISIPHNHDEYGTA